MSGKAAHVVCNILEPRAYATLGCPKPNKNSISLCRLASTPNSAELSGKAAQVVCAIIEADAEALQEANCAQEVISIDLEAPEHYCSPVFWKVCSPHLPGGTICLCCTLTHSDRTQGANMHHKTG